MIVALTLTLSACGGAPAETQTAAAFCESAVDVEAAASSAPPIDFGTATPEQIQTGMAEFGAQLEPLLAEVEQTAPEQARGSVTTLTRLTRQALSGGYGSIFESPEYTAADDELDSYMLDHCGYEHIEVTAADHEYLGLPETVTSGTKTITIMNEGAEPHEIGIARIHDGVTLSAAELLALPMDQAMESSEFTGRAAAAPGESGTVFLRLDRPGRYVAACFTSEGGGPPHVALGTATEITVE